MSCLGERLTALVDEELGHEERDRVLSHLAGCAQCRDEVAELRKVKRRLRGLSAGPAADGADALPTPDFLNRLRAMPASAGPPAPAGPAQAPPPEAPAPPERPAAQAPPARPARPLRSPARPSRTSPAGRPRDTRPPGRAAAVQVHPRRRYLVVGAATLFLGLGTASYVAGGEQDQPSVTPAFDRFAVEHALTSGDAPMTDPLTDPVYQVQVSPGP
ncbi:Putative zinc-finger [Actinomadura meyerae]|uniref:Putative zinc-finger n=1 Tax=Actinomadura meyerae TaxID=240840 RepID=A0A239FJJ7_9ACTN|nr:zf-HC2 domain-containing protein [Actinomadura meyerae]SNS56937.1 Putative zinc-finger [Actinomadura meyerae]